MHNVAICPPICINQFDGARPFHVHHACTFSFNRLTLVRYSSECLARLVATLIYLLSIPFDPPAPWHRVPRARKIAQAGSIYRYTAIRPSGEPSVCVPIACSMRETCVPARVCAFASCGFVVCPEGRTTSCLRRSRFICVPSPRPTPRLPGVTSPPPPPSPRFPHLPPPPSPLSPGSTHRSPACV